MADKPKGGPSKVDQIKALRIAQAEERERTQAAAKRQERKSRK